MKENKLTFQSEKFQIHYLTLNMQFDNLKRIKKIADYFSNTFDCNSVFIDCKNSTQNCSLIKKERSLWKAEFRVSEFLEFLGKKKTNYYQIRKVVDFLKSLQVLEDFSTESFRSILIFPYLEVRKEKSWKVELAIAEKVYFYRYPFYFPQEFLTYDDAYDFRAKIFFLLSFSTTKLDKEFQIQEVFDQVGISRQKMTRLRKSIVIIFEDAQDLKLIESRFTLLMKTNKTKEVDKLRSNLLVKAKSVFYTEIP